MAAAACKGMDTSLFYRTEPAEALAVCRACPVQAQCLQYAIKHEAADGRYRLGVFGGASAAERATLADGLARPA